MHGMSGAREATGAVPEQPTIVTEGDVQAATDRTFTGLMVWIRDEAEIRDNLSLCMCL